jgi:hypothetical protein
MTVNRGEQVSPFARKHRFAIASAIVIVAIGAVTFAPGAASRPAAWCNTLALTPQVQENGPGHADDRGRSHGGWSCPYGAYTFFWKQQLRNNAGNTLWSSGLQEDTAQGLEIWGAWTVCQGAILRTWQYVADWPSNTNPETDLSGTHSGCAY